MYKLMLNQKNIPQIILQLTPLRSVASFFLQILGGGGCDGSPTKFRIYNKYYIFLHSTTKIFIYINSYNSTMYN